MNRSQALGILKQLSDSRPTETDAELLGQFALHRDEAVFAALVQRHGRLVWGVCNQLAGSDADDAFQATFLVLLKNVGKARIANNLSAWLYGVSYRVCLKTRQSANRRTARERIVASKDANASIIPDSAWDRVLTTVHEEVIKLPDTLRIPFVLCTLEGKSATAAAKQLGWKVNTLSTRLARARDFLLSRLSAREIMAGSVAALACTATTAPAEVMARASGLVQGKAVVSGSILQLTHGVLSMNANHVKLLAAGVLLAFGLGIGSGAGWVANAGAQVPGPVPTSQLSPDEKVRLLEQQLKQAKQEAEAVRQKEEALKQMRLDQAKIILDFKVQRDAGTVHSTANWHYQFFPIRPMEAAQFVDFLQNMETKGWEYRSQMTIVKDKDKMVTVWLFRQPTTKPVGMQSTFTDLGVEFGTRGAIPPAGSKDVPKVELPIPFPGSRTSDPNSLIIPDTKPPTSETPSGR